MPEYPLWLIFGKSARKKIFKKHFERLGDALRKIGVKASRFTANFSFFPLLNHWTLPGLLLLLFFDVTTPHVKQFFSSLLWSLRFHFEIIIIFYFISFSFFFFLLSSAETTFTKLLPSLTPEPLFFVQFGENKNYYFLLLLIGLINIFYLFCLFNFYSSRYFALEFCIHFCENLQGLSSAENSEKFGLMMSTITTRLIADNNLARQTNRNCTNLFA